MTSTDFVPAPGQRLQRRCRVGLQPLGAAEARLEGHTYWSGPSPATRQQASGLLALAVVRVAEPQRALRHAVKTHHQLAAAVLGPAMALPVFEHRLPERRDVAGVIVKVLDPAHFGDVAHATEHVENLIQHRRRCRRRVLRVHRHDQDAVHTALGQAPQRRLNGRFAVAHCQFDLDVVSREPRGSRAATGPAVASAPAAETPARSRWRRTWPPTCAAATRRMTPCKMRPPQHPWDLHHTRIRQEFLQIAPHRPRLRRRRGARD